MTRLLENMQLRNSQECRGRAVRGGIRSFLAPSGDHCSPAPPRSHQHPMLGVLWRLHHVGSVDEIIAQWCLMLPPALWSLVSWKWLLLNDEMHSSQPHRSGSYSGFRSSGPRLNTHFSLHHSGHMWEWGFAWVCRGRWEGCWNAPQSPTLWWEQWPRAWEQSGDLQDHCHSMYKGPNTRHCAKSCRWGHSDLDFPRLNQP